MLEVKCWPIAEEADALKASMHAGVPRVEDREPGLAGGRRDGA
jgi:hypothetical protein